MLRDSFRRIRALIVKECYQIIYDPSSILISIVLPFILLFLYGFGVSLDLNTVKLGLVLEDTSPAAQSLAQSFVDSPYFHVTLAKDRRELLHPLLSGEIRGIVVIPSYFSTRLHLPQEAAAPIQVLTDGGEPNTASFVQNYTAQVWANWLQHEAANQGQPAAPMVSVAPRFWFNEALKSRNFLIPGSLAIIMTLIGTSLTALVIAREWERGTMEALLATPVHIREILAAKLISYFGMALCSMACCIVGSVLCYGIPFRGSLIMLMLATSAFLIPALGTGLLLSTATKNQLAASQAAQVVGFLPAFMLSGYLFEISSMPAPVRLVTYIVPARYFVRCLLSLFLVGNVWQLLLVDISVMVLIGIGIFALTSRMIVKRLD